MDEGIWRTSLIIDASALYAALDQGDRSHTAALSALNRAQPPLLLSPFILAEIDYLVSTRIGQAAARSFLDEVASGTYSLVAFDQSDLVKANAYIDRYPDIGLADASLLVLVDRFEAYDVLTFDLRHFRNVVANNRKKLRLLPADQN